jgi:predicted Ser/Thr protein kinase
MQNPKSGHMKLQQEAEYAQIRKGARVSEGVLTKLREPFSKEGVRGSAVRGRK